MLHSLAGPGQESGSCCMPEQASLKPSAPRHQLLPPPPDQGVPPAGAVPTQGQSLTPDWVSQAATEETGPQALVLQDGKPVLQLRVERGPTPAEARPEPGPVPEPCRLASVRPSRLRAGSLGQCLVLAQPRCHLYPTLVVISGWLSPTPPESPPCALGPGPLQWDGLWLRGSPCFSWPCHSGVGPGSRDSESGRGLV